MNERQTATIVLVEENADHAALIEKNLKRGGIVNEIMVLRDGGAAVDFLFQQSASSGDHFLVLLDLNLSALDGYEVLKHLKGDERTRRIPIVVLTSTDNPQEISRCYGLGCSAYVTKPVEYEQFSDEMRKLGKFLSIVKIPRLKESHG